MTQLLSNLSEECRIQWVGFSLTAPAKAFEEAGHTVTTIEMEQGRTVIGKQGDVEVTIDESIDSVKPEHFDALFIPGGFSPDQLRADARFVTSAKSFMDEKNCIRNLSWTTVANYC